MAFAEKDAVIAEFFGPHRAFVNLVDVSNAAVDAVQAEFHLKEAIGIKQQTIVGAGHAMRDEFYGWNATNPQPVAQGTTGS